MVSIDAAHVRWHGRRVAVLADRLARYIPEAARVIDIGCGDGRLAHHLLAIRPDLTITGYDVLPRRDAALPVRLFDGRVLPLEAGSFDVALLVDVLHHADEPAALLAEAVRTSTRAVVLKDHLLEGPFAGATLRFMDRVGNERHGVHLPYNYWNTAQWRACFAELGLHADVWNTNVGLYPWPASLLFDRSLHVIARLSRAG